jgi:hypothetical protein
MVPDLETSTDASHAPVNILQTVSELANVRKVDSNAIIGNFYPQRTVRYNIDYQLSGL